jgi:hypothetical protein
METENQTTWCNFPYVLHHFAICRRQTHPAASRGSKKSRMHMKVPSTTTLSFPTLSPLLTAGKNIVGYFLDRVVCILKYCVAFPIVLISVTTNFV